LATPHILTSTTASGAFSQIGTCFMAAA
jgi:hypothetical protein